MITVGRQRAKYLVSDVLSATLAFLFLQKMQVAEVGVWTLLPYCLIWLFVYWLTGYYNNPFSRSRLVEFVETVVATFLGATGLFFCLLLMRSGTELNWFAGIFLRWAALHFLLTYAGRLLVTQIFFLKIKQGIFFGNVLVVGTGEVACKVRIPWGLQMVGYVRCGEESVCVPQEKVLGDIGDLPHLIEKYDVREVIVASRISDNAFVCNLLRMVLPFGISLNVLEAAPISTRARMDNIKADVLFSLTDNVMPEWQCNVKRLFDLFFSAIVLLVASPVMAYIAWRVSRTSAGPIFYRQERIGKSGKPFNIIKFRTMYEDSEDKGPSLSSEHDERVTPVGMILRRYRLDELPQFWNVLKGDMSIVGYRPERQFFIEKIAAVSPDYFLLLRILPGITSWGMVKFGYARSVDEMCQRLKYDLLYAENRNLLIDIKILIHTFGIICKGRGC